MERLHSRDGRDLRKKSSDERADRREKRATKVKGELGIGVRGKGLCVVIADSMFERGVILKKVVTVCVLDLM